MLLYFFAKVGSLLVQLLDFLRQGGDVVAKARLDFDVVLRHGDGVTLGDYPVSDLAQLAFVPLAQFFVILLALGQLPQFQPFAAFAGLRRSEIQGLRWCDWDGDQLHVRQSVFNHVVNEPKSAASRNWVPVVPQLREALESYRADRQAHDQFGLMQDETARMFRYTLDHVGRKHVTAAFRRAGLTFAGYHGFRRGLASNLFELGCDDLTVMRILRHASVQITRSAYIKVRDGILESAMARLADAAKQSGNGLADGSAKT